MYLCLIELRSQLGYIETDLCNKAETMIRRQLIVKERVVRLNREQVLLILQTDSYDETKAVLDNIRECIAFNCGCNVSMNCGFSEVKSSDYGEAKKNADQLLIFANKKGYNQSAGFRYYEFPNITESVNN